MPYAKMREFCDLLGKNPIIAAVFDTAELPAAIDSDCEAIFLLCGSICDLAAMNEAVHQKGKKMYIHLDLLGGIGKDHYTVQYLKSTFNPDGVLTTKSNLVKYARDAGLFVIQRVFLLDSKSYETIIKTAKNAEADAIEILPGIIPSAISQICQYSKIPVITGGMVRKKGEALDSLQAGAIGVSTSCRDLW